GITTVSASSGGVTGETTMTVTDALLVMIEVSPSTPSIATGLTQQFTATGHYTDASTQDLTTQVAWGSSDGTVATVSTAAGSNGLATAAALGTTTLSATSGDVTGVATLTVTEAPPSVDDMVAALLAAVPAVGPGSSLVTKMTDVQTSLAVPDIVSACSALDSFKTLVAAQ